MSTIDLMLGDCLERMKEIEDSSVDMILCDLPYGTTACSWDSIIPMELLWSEYKRIIVGSGAIVLFGSQPFTTTLVSSNIKDFKYCWVWEKNRPTNFAHAKNKPMKKHEDICVFSSGTTVHASQSKTRMPYYPQGLTEIVGKKVTKKSSEKTDAFFSDRPGHGEFTRNFTNYPHSMLEFSTDQLGLHPTAKPVALCEYLINTYSLEGQTVLDNTMGSGTTGVACVNTGRNFIGIEKDENYFKIATDRINNSKENLIEH